MFAWPLMRSVSDWVSNCRLAWNEDGEIVHLDGARDLVRSRLRDDVDHRARRPAELGRDAGLLDVEVRDVELVRVDAEGAVARVRHVDAVEEVLVLLARAAGHGDVADSARVGGGAGDDLDDALVRPREREVLEGVVGVVEVALGRLLVDLGDRAGHDDFRLRGRHERERHLRVVVDEDLDLLAGRAEALEFGRDDVVAGQKDPELERAVRVGDGRVGRLRAGDFHRGAGHRKAAAVLDDAGDRAGLTGPRRRREDGDEEHETDSRDQPHFKNLLQLKGQRIKGKRANRVLPRF